MSFILPNRQQPNFLESLLGGLPQTIENVGQQKLQQEAAQKEYQNKLLLEGYKSSLKSKEEQRKAQQTQEVLNNFFGGQKGGGVNPNLLLNPSQEPVTPQIGPEGQAVEAEGDIGPQQGMPQPQFDISQIPPEAIASLGILNPTVANQITQLQKTALQQKQNEIAQEADIRKYNQDFRQKTLDQFAASKEQNIVLDRLSNLNNENELTTPLMASTLDRFGIPISVLGDPESEEFQKLSLGLLNGIQSYFGNRINMIEVQNFLKTIPTLMNSKEGRAKILKNMKIVNDAKRLRYDSYMKHTKGGKNFTYDLQEKVIEEITPKIEKLAEEFKDNQKVKMFKDGREFDVPPEYVEIAKSKGYTQ